MTERSERIKAAHRGARFAEPASESRLKALTRAGLRFERLDDTYYMVEGQFFFHPATGFWRDASDADTWGYTVPAMHQVINLRKNRNAAALAVQAGLGEFADALPSAPESLHEASNRGGQGGESGNASQPLADLDASGSARIAPDETRPGENAGELNTSGACGEAAAGAGSEFFSSRNLLPEVLP